MPAEEPQRTCVGCRSRRPQQELTRLHLDEAGRLQLARNGAGRGAWLCRDRFARCLAAAIKRNGFARAFRRSPDRASVSELSRRWPIGDRD